LAIACARFLPLPARKKKKEEKRRSERAMKESRL
jgi:hypothetical protein